MDKRQERAPEAELSGDLQRQRRPIREDQVEEMKPRYFSNEALAAAYELNQEGISWKLIARHFGDGIQEAVRYTKVNGLPK